MSAHPSARRLLPLLAALLLVSCGDSGTEAPGAPGGVAKLAKWSDPATWPDRRVPQAGALVVIPAGKGVLLDVSPPPLAGLRVEGRLVFDRRDLGLTAGWISVTGHLQAGTETEPYLHRGVITLTGSDTGENVEGMGSKFLGVVGGTLELHGAPRTPWTRLAATTPKGATQLVLEKAPDWVPGDRLVVASTDYDPAQAEEVVVKEVRGTTVLLEQPLRYVHWGALQTIAGRTVDTRAEVGLLTRNLVVRGDDLSAGGFGAHVMIMGTARISGVELHNVGQRGKLARYPVHWHMMGEAEGQYLRESSIWRSHNRCVTVHGTSALAVQRNVCYDHVGHGFFLEDGAETRNVLEGNLGLRTRAPAAADALLPSDSRPATYWITNPDNTFRGNVAAGSQGFGFWFALPEHPTGPSANPAVWPRRTPLREFTGNVAHSNRSAGLQVDDGPKPDGTTETTSYRPRQNPAAESPAVVAEFRGFTAYKHGGQAVWLRGSNQKLVGAVLADNAIGATFAASETFLEDALIVGESENRTPLPSATFPVRGFEFYDGRVGADRVVFANFQPTAQRPASGFGFKRANGFTFSTANFASGVRFVNANGLYLEAPRADKDGDRNAVALDTDGSVTGTVGAYVVANLPHLVVPGCTARPEWNAQVCRGRYLDLRVSSPDASVAPLDVRRDDGASVSLVGIPNNPLSASLSAIAGRGYALAFRGAAPAKLRLSVSRMAAGDGVRMAAPYPGTRFVVYREGESAKPFAAAASLAEVVAGAGDRYFFDVAAGVIHLKLVPKAGTDRASVYVDPR